MASPGFAGNGSRGRFAQPTATDPLRASAARIFHEIVNRLPTRTAWFARTRCFYFYSNNSTPIQRMGPVERKNQAASPSTAWNIDCRAWLMIWPFHTSVSV